MLKQKLERDDVSKSSRSKMRSAIAGKKSIVLIEQPDAGRFASAGSAMSLPGLGEQLPRLAFFPDPDPPRLGHFPDSLFDRLELLLTRLLEAALVGPALAPLGAPLFGVRAFDVGVAGSREGFPRRSGLFVGLFGGFCRLRGGCSGLRRRYVVGGLLFGAAFSSARTLLVDGAALRGRRCRLRLRLWLRLRLLLCRRGQRVSSQPHAAPAPLVPSRRLSVPPTSCVPAWRPPA